MRRLTFPTLVVEPRIPEHAVWPVRHVFAPPDVELRLCVRLCEVEIVDEVVHLRMIVADRDTGEPVPFTVRHGLDPALASRCAWDAQARAEAVREALIGALTHEVDEAIRVQGVRVFDPHVPEKLLREMRADEG